MAKIKAKHYREQTCCGTIQDAKYNARAAKGNKPQPWIALKLTIGMSMAIIGYTGYVYIGRFCVPMILRQQHALGGRTIGVVFLVIFCILALMLFWTYTKVVVVSPGHARDYTPKSPEPTFGGPLPPRDSYRSDEIGGTAYENMSVPATHSEANPLAYSHSETISNGHPPIRQHSLSEKNTVPSSPKQTRSSVPQTTDVNAGVLDTLPPVRAARHLNPEAQAIPNEIGHPTEFQSIRDTRMPSNVPILLPEHRYCKRDGIVKPYRAHHCRACGTCVLKYDHHCPWIGQCVGARNHKFFVNFLQWVSVFCLWVFSTTLGLNVKVGADIDPQEIAVIAISGFFSLFTTMMLISQVRMVGFNVTTVESLQEQSMKERERATLSRLHSFHHFRAKAETKRKWDDEWGNIGTEGNLWWLGSFRANWEAVMGQSVWWWFLPIGRSASDGLQYPINPRFDEQGRWKRRKEWPAELR